MTGCCPGTLALSSKSLKIANPKVSRLVESEMKSSRLMEEFYDRGNKKKGETGILHKVKGFIKKRW